MKSIAFLTYLIISGALASTVAAQGRGPSPNSGNGPGVCSSTSASVLPAPADEIKSLTFTRKEERLAQDVYQALGAKWNLKTFQNIAQSESRHTAAIATLLTRYGLPDPALGLSAGTYADQALTTLYAQLIEKGSLSIKDALEVGIAIEAKDIGDLETVLKSAEKVDLKKVYTNFMDASYNHAEAFEASLELYN